MKCLQTSRHVVVTALVAILIAACTPSSSDTSISVPTVPPFEVVWNTERVPRAGCEVDTVVKIVTGFLAAFNRGDLDAALAYFPDREQQNDIDPTGLQWFSIQETVAFTPEELRAVIAELQDDGVRLRLSRLDITWSSWRDTAEMGIEMMQVTDDQPQIELAGKAGIDCKSGHIWVLSAGASPEPVE